MEVVRRLRLRVGREPNNVRQQLELHEAEAQGPLSRHGPRSEDLVLLTVVTVSVANPQGVKLGCVRHSLCI